VATDDPMMASVAGRYASALFELANEERKLAEVEQDMTLIASLLEASADLRRMVRSPVFTADEQGKAIAAIADRFGISPLSSNFLRLLARNRRLFALADVLKAFRAILARHRGEITADVTSAHPLSEAQLNALTDTLAATAGGKRVKINTRVDPAILGGLVVKMGSRMIDSSLRTKLNSLKIAMKEVR
jgi:F-type H+-transporting ATPase subunit delta